MDDLRQARLAPSASTHPGESVLDYLDSYDWSQADLARLADLPLDEVEAICSGRAGISPRVAAAFEKIFKRPAHLWLNLQTQFDQAVARRSCFASTTTLSEWTRRFPLSEMRALRFSLPAGLSDTDALLEFFGVNSLESWNSNWSALNVAYRQTRNCVIHQHAVAAWIREAEIIAMQIETQDFDHNEVRGSIEELRNLTRDRADTSINQLQSICARSGISVVVVPALKHTGISGCAHWISDGKAMIGLTLRYKSDDQLWFTFFHELGHILLHNNRHSLVIDNTERDLLDECIDPSMEQYEAEANQFSSNTLIPQDQFDGFCQDRVFTNESIHDFAEKINIGPGIVVGRLQFEGLIGMHQGNALKQKLDWDFKSKE